MEGVEDAVSRFRTITGADEQTARYCLQSCNGNIDEAVHLFFTTDASNQRRQAPEINEDPRERQTAFGHVSNFVKRVVGLPYWALRRYAEYVLKEEDEVLIAADFVRDFESQYGERHPAFIEMSWKEATRQADRQSKLLFVYIHAPEHEDTEDFCQRVLTTNEVVSFLNQHFVCWGGTLEKKSAFLLASSVGASTFPFVCVLDHKDTEVKCVASIHGKVEEAGRLIQILQQSVNREVAAMVEQRAERTQREIDRQLIRDQDIEYQRGLEADRERERQKREVEAARIAAEQEALRKAEQERLLQEAEKRQREERAAAIIRRRQQKQASLKPETTQPYDIVLVRVRLADGSAHTRKFLVSDKIKDVYDFVDGLESLEYWDYTLASSYPKIEFTPDTRSRTLKEMGIEHSVTLLVQTHDD